MHHQAAVLAQGQGLLAQPVQQHSAVRGLQHIGQGVAAVGRAHAVGHGQSMQVVVAQHTLRRSLQGHHAAQHRRRGGPAVDQIPEQHQLVAAG